MRTGCGRTELVGLGVIKNQRTPNEFGPRFTTPNRINWTCRICDANLLDSQEGKIAHAAPVAKGWVRAIYGRSTAFSAGHSKVRSATDNGPSADDHARRVLGNFGRSNLRRTRVESRVNDHFVEP
jgi:hypothetical protein